MTDLRRPSQPNVPILVQVEEVERFIARLPLRHRREWVPLSESLGRVTARGVYAPTNVPPFRRAAMDGFAVRRADIIDASSERPCRLRVWDEAWAGDPGDATLREGRASRVATGAMVPSGAEIVIPLEHVLDTDDGYIEIDRHWDGGSNIAEPGEEIAEGTLCVRMGETLQPQHLGLLASVGVATVELFAKPRVGLVNTGDELVEVGKALCRGDVYNSGYYALAGALRRDGACVSGAPISVPDEGAAIIDAVAGQCSQGVDVILLTGGVSVGERDLIPKSLFEFGAELLFWRVRMRPGKAFAVARYSHIPIFALSGNPTAALTCYELFVRPYLTRLAGRTAPVRATIQAVLTEPFGKASEEWRFVRGRASWVASGGWRVSLPSSNGEVGLRGWIGSNCFVCIPPQTPPLPAGSEVNIVLDHPQFL